MGDPDVRIVPMGGQRFYHPGKPIPGVSRGDVSEMLSGSMAEVGPIVSNLRITSDKLRQMTTDTQGVIGVLTSREVADGLLQTLHDLRGIAKTMRSLGIADMLADNKIADRIVGKWWHDNVMRNMPVEEAFERWKLFVRCQKALDQTLITADPAFPEGQPWKRAKLEEW